MEDRPKKFTISFLKKDEPRTASNLASTHDKGRPSEGAPLPSEGDAPRPETGSKDVVDFQADQAGRGGHEGEKGPAEAEEEEAWLQVGLVVQIQEMTLSHGLYNGMTGIIKAVVGPGGYGAEVQVTNGDILRLDQDNIKPLLPSPGDFGLMVRGTYKDTKVRVIAMGKDDVEVELEEGRRAGHRLLLPPGYVSRHIAIKSRN